MNRNQALINFIGFAFVIIFALFILETVMRDDGANINSAKLSDRDSFKYINKNVNDDSNRIVSYGNSGYEDGSANIVSSIVVNYRMFDTLGEILVLFASTAGVALLLGVRRASKIKEATSIAQTAVSIISLAAIILGSFIVIHGHITPGGGFPGGALIASALILLILISKANINQKAFLILESVSGLAILGVGLGGFFYNGTFFENFMPTGNIGTLFSSGTVMVLYILIGVKVASEIFSIGHYFLRRGE